MSEVEIMPLPERAQPMVPAPVSQSDAMVAMIERIVLDPSVPLDRLEHMLAMKERLDAQAARKAFDLAMSEAKAAIPPITKNRTVSYGAGKTSYRHEDLAEIARTVDPILGAHGLSYRYRTNQNGATVTVTCVVSHRDGHSEETTLSSGVDTSGSKNAIQAVGSAITYLQRYTLKAALGLAAAEDDDGGREVASAESLTGAITQAQNEELFGLIEETKSDINRFLAFFGVEGLDVLPAAKFAAARQMLMQKRTAR